VAWAGLLAAPACVLSVAAAQPPAGTGALTWSDEFSGATLDPTRWTYRSPGPRSDAVESPTAVSVGGGLLTIETYTDAAGRNYSGMVGTQQVGAAGFEQTYGYFEARVKFNTAPGQWSAFWLQTPTNGTPVGDPATAGVEMDIAEHRARCVTAPAPTPPETCAPDSDISNRIQEALIWDGYGADSKSSVKLSDPLPGLGNGSWHTWGLRWTPTDLTFYYDDTPIWTKTDPISRRSEFIVLSSEVGQSFAGATPRGGYGAFQSSTTTMQVDYVRVWALS
jgi:beta-glucanase (GH16 family)